MHNTTVAETEFNQANMVQQIIEGVQNELNIDDSEDHQATDFVTQMANAAMSSQQVIL